MKTIIALILSAALAVPAIAAQDVNLGKVNSLLKTVAEDARQQLNKGAQGPILKLGASFDQKLSNFAKLQAAGSLQAEVAYTKWNAKPSALDLNLGTWVNKGVP